MARELPMFQPLKHQLLKKKINNGQSKNNFFLPELRRPICQMAGSV